MTEHNHRRGTVRRLNRLFKEVTELLPENSRRKGNGVQIVENTFTYVKITEPLHNGFPPRVGRAYGMIDHSLHGAKLVKTKLSAKIIGGKSIGNDFNCGHRGEARSVRGAKKFVRTRTRFHENAATRKLMREDKND